ASQCGFCTPGFVMSLWARPPGAPVDRQSLEDRLAGNLCRCTGYGPILEAAAAAAPESDTARDAAEEAAVAKLLANIRPLDMSLGRHRILAPHDEATFAAAVADNPDARIIAGGTDVGLWITKNLHDPGSVIFVGEVAELQHIGIDGDTLTVGAAVTHEAFTAVVADLSPSLAEMMRRFGGLQVRSAGTVGGNIGNGSPIGDLPPALIAAGATLSLGHCDGGRTMPLEDYFLDYGKQDRRPGEYVRGLHVPVVGLKRLTCHKISKRFDSDISAVMMAIALDVDDGVVAARIACGGMAATPRRAPATEAALIGNPFTRETITAAQTTLEADFAPISDMRASADYRIRVAKNLLMRDFIARTAPDVPVTLAGGAVGQVAA
ncbi:MAG: FAD binding domain-containing protein, partial [Pseudomonadota bacterium]